MKKEETYIYQIYDYMQNDFFEIDILHDKLEFTNDDDEEFDLNEEKQILNVIQNITIDKKTRLNSVNKLYVTRYELRRLFKMYMIKGVNWND